jgi:trehalose 6-phosphate synthase/trehalose 6-phosphate phosphatase
VLDYDGTLAPYRVARPRAVPPEQTREKLAALAHLPRTRIAVVSGRPVRELESLLAPLVFYWVGENGWEERAPGQPLVEHPLPVEAQTALEQALDDVRGRAFGGRVERQRTGLVLHTRGLFPDSDRALCRACEAVWRPWTERAPLRLDRTNGGLVLRARDRDKGTAVRGLRERAKEPDLVVYVGDDETDEDAFRELGESGFGIRVGESGTTTLARGTLPSAAAVSDYLGHWLDTEISDARRSGTA